MGARAEAIDDLDETTLEGRALASVARAREGDVRPLVRTSEVNLSELLRYTLAT
jgi:hypothetical protein